MTNIDALESGASGYIQHETDECELLVSDSQNKRCERTSIKIRHALGL